MVHRRRSGLLVGSGCSGGDTPEDALDSEEVAETSEVIQGRLSGAVYDTLPDSLEDFSTPSSRILIGRVSEIRGDRGFIDIDESTLSEHEGGEETVFDSLPERQVAELIDVLERGDLPSPLEVDFDSPIASWRTAQLVIELESQITADGQNERSEQAVVGVSLPASIDLSALDGYQKIGRAAFFVDASPVFGGTKGFNWTACSSAPCLTQTKSLLYLLPSTNSRRLG